jgi:hypothetical protein
MPNGSPHIQNSKNSHLPHIMDKCTTHIVCNQICSYETFKKNAFVNLTDFAKGVFPPNININYQLENGWISIIILR